MSLHCIGRRNVESIVCSAWGSVGAGVDKIRQNSPFFVCFGRRGVRILSRWYTKFGRKACFLSTLGGAGSSIYGQIPEIAILPVTGGCILRANLKNRSFARNPRQPFKLITTIPRIFIRKRKNRTFGAFKLPQKFCVFA